MSHARAVSRVSTTLHASVLLAAVGGAVAWLAILFKMSTTEQGTVNFPPPRYWRRIYRLWQVWRELREMMRLTSAFRDDRTNELVAGANGSLHKFALALDGVVTAPFSDVDVLIVLDDMKRRGIVKRWLYHNVGSGFHWHIELTEED